VTSRVVPPSCASCWASLGSTRSGTGSRSAETSSTADPTARCSRSRRRLDALTVIGNHEVALLEGKRTATLDVVRRQLGSALEEWLAWLSSRPLFVRQDGYILVHAGIAPGKRPRSVPEASSPRSEPSTASRGSTGGEAGDRDLRALGRARQGGSSALQGSRHRMCLWRTAHRTLVAATRVGLGSSQAPLVRGEAQAGA